MMRAAKWAVAIVTAVAAVSVAAPAQAASTCGYWTDRDYAYWTGCSVANDRVLVTYHFTGTTTRCVEFGRTRRLGFTGYGPGLVAGAVRIGGCP